MSLMYCALKCEFTSSAVMFRTTAVKKSTESRPAVAAGTLPSAVVCMITVGARRKTIHLREVKASEPIAPWQPTFRKLC